MSEITTEFIIQILVILSIGYFLYKYFQKHSPRSINIQQKSNITTNKEQKSTFRKKYYLLTQNELAFYRVLKPITDKLELNLFCQVVLYQIVNTSSHTDFNKIRSKSIDFVITDLSGRIKCCIELDDSTHQKRYRMNRDILLNNIFKEINMPLLRFKVASNYNVEEIEQKIKDSV